MDEFKEKIAIITGAASGLGLGIATELSKRGSVVILLDVDKERLENASRENIVGNRVIKIVDVTNYEEVKKAFDDVQNTYGRIDFLFNNAGIGGTLPFGEATLAHWKKIIDLNLYGVIHGMTAIFPIMKKQNSGHIVNTSSIAGIIPFPGQALYNTTKYAVTGLSLSLEKELRASNIRISIVCPGMVKTRIFYKPILGEEAPEEYVKIPPEAIRVEEAVKDILQGIKRKQKIIITPKFLNRVYWKYRITGTL